MCAGTCKYKLSESSEQAVYLQPTQKLFIFLFLNFLKCYFVLQMVKENLFPPNFNYLLSKTIALQYISLVIGLFCVCVSFNIIIIMSLYL